MIISQNWQGNPPLFSPLMLCIMAASFFVFGKYCSLIHLVKPGLTGLWQVLGRNDLTCHRRIAVNVYYVRHHSWKRDQWSLCQTAWAVIGGKGAC